MNAGEELLNKAGQETGTNPTVIVLTVVCGGMALLATINVILWYLARKTQGPKQHKKTSKKKEKRQNLSRPAAAAG